MLILDTHVWIWLESTPERLDAAILTRLRGERVLGLSPVSVWEFGMAVERRKIELDLPPEQWVRTSLSSGRIVVVPLEPAAALQAAFLGQDGFHSDPFDRMLYATAVHRGDHLVTADAAIQAFDHGRPASRRIVVPC